MVKSDREPVTSATLRTVVDDDDDNNSNNIIIIYLN